MRVLLFTQYYPPEVGATQNRMQFFATWLASKGHDVTVVTEVPNHPAGIIFDGFRRIAWRRSVEDGVTVIRVWVSTSPRKTSWVRTAFYLSYAINATLAGLLLTGRRHDVVFATSPPLPVGLPAWVYAKLRRVPFILDVRDLWPILAVQLGELRSPCAVKLAQRLEQLFYRDAAAVTVVTRGFADHLREQGCANDRIAFLPNGTVPEVFHPLEPESSLRTDLELDGKFVVGFFGNHGIAQDLHSVIEAARLLAEQGQHHIQFVFVGEGPVKSELVERVSRAGLTNVKFHPQVTQADVGRYIALVDVMLVPLRKLDLFLSFVPSKLFDAMACARPILLQVDGEARQILDEAGAGFFVPPGQPEALAAAIRRMADLEVRERRALGAAGRAYVGRHYLRGTQAVRLESMLHALVAGEQVPADLLVQPPLRTTAVHSTELG